MLVRRNTGAKFEGAPAETAAPAATTQPATTVAAPAQPPSQPAQTAQTSAVGAPTDVTGNANAGGPATVPGVALMRRQANAGAVGALVRNSPPALEELKDAFSVQYDTFERLKSGSGNIVDANNNDLGREIAITLVSWQETWDISPGSNAPEAKKVVRYSDDGVYIKGTGQNINEYLAELRQGKIDGVAYPNASIKSKIVLVGVLEGSEKPSNLWGKTVQVSLSEQSAKTFNRHRFDASIQVTMGKRESVAGAEKIHIKAESRSSNGNNYTLLICSEDTGA